MEYEEVSCAGCCDEDAVSSSGTDDGPCCCCHYDPYEDDSPEMRIQDLSFALRKLSVMKCQMRKWRLERLELESNNRSLKLALQQCGVEPDEALRPDPLLVHLRGESLRLQNRCDALEDEARDLRETLADRERYDGPCDAAAHVKAKILELRHRHAVEKNQLRETIANLRVRLAEAQEDSSCGALNRLRAKLRELTRGEKKADQQVSTVVGKSIETMVEFSKSCDELRRENERLLAEVETLKEIKEEKYAKESDLEKGSKEISDLSKRVNACEDLVAQMRLQLAEKDDIINDLQKKLYAERRNSNQLENDLDKMAVSQKALTTEINAMKGELKEKDGKVTKLLRDLRNSTAAALGMSDLESQIERLRPGLYQLETQRDELMDELTRLRQELSSRNDQIIKILEEREKMQAKAAAELEQARAKIRALEDRQEELDGERKRAVERIKELEKELKRLSEIDDLSDELTKLRAEYEASKAESARKEAELRRAEQERQSLAEDNQRMADKVKRCNGELEELAAKIRELQSARDDLESQVKVLECRLGEEVNGSDGMRKELDRAREEESALRADLRKCEEEVRRIAEERDSLAKAMRNLEAEEAKLRDSVTALRANEEELNGRIRELQESGEMVRSENERLKRQLADLTRERDALNDKLNSADAELAEVKRQLVESRTEVDRYKKELADLSKELGQTRAAGDSTEKSNTDLRSKMDALTDTQKKLNSELQESNAEKAKLSTELQQSKTEVAKLNDRVNDLNNMNSKLSVELSDLKSEKSKLNDKVNELNAANSKLSTEVDKLLADLDRLKSEKSSLENRMNELNSANANLTSELGRLKAELAKLNQELGTTTSQKKQLENALEQARDDALAATKELELNKKLLVDAQNTLANVTGEKDRLEREVGDLKWQLDKIKKDLDAELAAKAELLKQLQDAQAALERCQSQHASFEAEVSKLKLQLAETEKAKEAAESAKSAIEQTRKNVQSELVSIKRASQVISREKEKLKQENEKARVEVAKARRHSAMLVGELSRVQSRTAPGDETARLAKELQQCRDELQKLRAKQSIKSTQETNVAEATTEERVDGGDFLRASEMLADHMERQIQAVDRVKDFINYAKGKINEKPEIKLDLSLSGGDWLLPQINELFEKAKKLSDAIIEAEKEAQNLQQTGQGDVFDATSWLQSLSMMELAELHDKICEMTEHMVREDLDEDEDLEAARQELLNSRIAALQRKIAEKQYEAALRADEMRRALMLEQAQLVTLANETNLQRERNLALFMSVNPGASPGRDASPCCSREECMLAGCRDASHSADRRK